MTHCRVAHLCLALAVASLPPGCGRSNTSSPGAERVDGEPDPVAPATPAVQPGPKARAKAAAAPVGRGPGLIYRQAGDQARQRLNAANAHLRLDELELQIEHEQEINR